LPPISPRSALTRRLSLYIWGLFLVLLLLLSVLGYAALQLSAGTVVPLVLQKMVQLKAEASEKWFEQADDSVRRLRIALVRQLDANAANPTTPARFAHLFARSADGLWRLRPQWVDPEHAPTLYLHAGAQGPDASAQLRAVTSYELLRAQGPALVPPFFSVYMDFVEDGLMVYARDFDWGGNADAQASNANYPTMRGADPAHNPERKIFWTPVYLDQQAHTWMVSVIAPLDWQGRWVGTVGHDLSVQTLIDAVANTDDEPSQQLIIDADGHLIAHPQLRQRIAAADGQLQIASLGDPLLLQVQALLAHAPEGQGVGRTPDGSHWVAWARIKGPGWHQVMLLPQAQVHRLLLLGLAMLCGIGILALLPALWVLRAQLHRQVAAPLQRLAQAVDALGRGSHPSPLPASGADELGHLAQAFNTLAAELQQQRQLQTEHAQALQEQVQERTQALGRLHEERTRLLALLGAMDRGILFASAQGQVTYSNAQFLRLWGLAKDALSHTRTESYVLTAITPQLLQSERFTLQLQHILAQPQESGHMALELRDGRSLLLDAHPVRDTHSRPMGRLWVCEDVTHKRRTTEQLLYLAERDALTGLYNRNRFEQVLERFFAPSGRNPQPAALLCFDLDDFKYVNDTFGHQAGDQLLVRVASSVRAVVREGDVLCRLGGDEFAVFMPYATLAEGEQLAAQVLQAMAQTPLHIARQTLRLGGSLGLAHCPSDASDAQELLAHADAAMYQAKASGKNRISRYRADRDGSQAMVARMAWSERITQALEHDRLRLHYQGVYHAQTGELAHLEALIRMVDEADPEHLIPPAEFIGHAEKTNKILAIDRWVIRESVRVLATHPQLPALAINISGRSFDDPDLPAYIAGELQAQGVPPRRLLVELTETSAISDLGDAERFIAALRHSGCSICLDDFGTGFASFAYLKQLRVDVLKIDGLFIRNLPQDRDNQVFVRSIIEVAHGMGKHTVAEFVEDEATLHMLQAMGVDMVQGYHLDRPQAAHPALAPRPAL
jgi:diguanylate cyclase (GGDEF)-like protein